MHHIYHTEGIILGSKNSKEAGKVLYVFTRELGMVIAVATGLRKLSSKLRYVLQDYSHVRVDLVRGRDIWRVTSASKLDSAVNFSDNLPAYRIFVNVSKLLKKLLSGEQMHEDLYQDFISGLRYLSKAKNKEDLSNAEAVLVLRLLSHLGYISSGEHVDDLVISPFTDDIFFKISKKRIGVLREINKALRETGL